MSEEGKNELREMNLIKMIKESEKDLEASSKLREALRERYPEQRKEINLLINVYEAGILEQIKEITDPSGMEIKRFAKMLEEEYGLEKNNSVWAVKTWAKAYGVDFDERRLAIEYIKKAIEKYLYSPEVEELFAEEKSI